MLQDAPAVEMTARCTARGTEVLRSRVTEETEIKKCAGSFNDSTGINPSFCLSGPFVDENLDPILVLALRKLGWKAQSVVDVGLSGRSDEEILAHAWREKQLLLTSDSDFT